MKKIIIMIFLILLFTGCNKSALSTEDFIVKLQDEGYIVKDVLSSYPVDVLVEAYQATNDNYVIDFNVTEDIEQAASAYNLYKKLFSQDETSSISHYEVIKDNYAKYYLINDKISVVSMINNTYLHIEADAKYEDDVLKILDKIGY